jgi:S-adenosylmethionine hydrolase
MKIITFTSDFGANGWFVAAVKGEIIKLAVDVRIVDITHNIIPHDIRSAAFLLHAVYDNFPKGTIHLAVVDPGVGGDRKPIIVESRDHLFVGPDNGLFSYVYDRASKVYEIIVESIVSSTFHARDIFGPTAARLAMGRASQALGQLFDDYLRFEIPGVRKEGKRLFAEIVYIDHFGNLITNIPIQHKIETLRVSDHVVDVKNDYGAGKPGELICVPGSIGYYEIACNKGSAREMLGATVGMCVEAL